MILGLRRCILSYYRTTYAREVSEKSVRGRPWARGAVLDRLVAYMGDQPPKDWGVRELARAVGRPRSTVEDALVLGESIRPEDYETWGGGAPRLYYERRGRYLPHANGRGVVRRREGRWHLHAHEPQLAAGWIEIQHRAHLVQNQLEQRKAWIDAHPRQFRLRYVYPGLLVWRLLKVSGVPVPPLDFRTVDRFLRSCLEWVRILKADPEAPRPFLALPRFGVAILLKRMGLRSEDPEAELERMLEARERVFPQP